MNSKLGMVNTCDKVRESVTSGSERRVLYDKEYFDKHLGPYPYRWGEPYWIGFFDKVAEEIVRTLKPRTVFDIGCGIGFLVSALWKREVNAYGIDISEYAIGQVPTDLQPFCRLASAAEPLPADFPQTYDLITCIEVLEHMPEEEAKVAIRNMAATTACIFFSSTPHDFDEPTHINVRPVIYWLELFAEVGFYPDLRFDASFVSPQAFLLGKNRPRLKEDTLPFFAEGIYRRLDLHAQQAEILKLTNANEELQKRFEVEVRDRGKQIASLSAEIARLTQTIDALNEELRRESTERESLVREVSILQANASQILREKEALSAQIADLQEGLREIQAEKLRLTGENEELQRTSYGKEKELSQLRAALSAKEDERRGLEARLLEQDAKIHLMQEAQSGLFWELLSAYRRAKDRYLPPGTKPRRVYDLGLREIKLLKNEGLRSFAVRTLVTARSVVYTLKAGGVQGLRQRLLDRLEEIHEYKRWVENYDILTDVDRILIRDHIERLSYKPLISVIMPTYNTPEKWLRMALESVKRQLYPNWELCISDDASSQPHVTQILQEYQATEPRIRAMFRGKNGNISCASNSALAMATGEFIAVLDHDDELAEHALYMVAVELNRHPEADLIYTDEDKIDEVGRRYNPYFKPDWNPDLFMGQNFVCHLAVYRTRHVRDVGGFCVGFEGSQDWDLTMRIIERIPVSHVRHIPSVLYHWRAVPGSAALGMDQKKYAREAQLKTLVSHFDRTGQDVVVVPAADIYWRIKYPLPQPPPYVTLIIPTRNGFDLLERCVESIYGKTTYPNFELIIVDNQSDDPQLFAYLRKLERDRGARILRFDAPFNYSGINNFAVRHARGEIIGLINNDLAVITPEWLEEMVSHAVRPEVGAVGAMLYCPNDTIQHAGVVLGLGGVAGHAYKHRPRGYPGQSSRALLCQALSAVTAACLLMRREIYEDMDGMDEQHLAIAFNDIDLCLRIREKGYWNLWTPYAELYHYESASRGYEYTPDKQARFNTEANYMRQRWGKVLLGDPAYNPNLALDRESFMLSFPPRAKRLWHEAAAGKAV